MIKRRGRPSKVDVESLINCFTKYKDRILYDGNICSKKCEIWTTMSHELNNRISGPSLYSYLYDKNLGIKEILLSEKESSVLETDYVDSLAETTANTSTSVVIDETETNFTISVPKVDFDNIVEERWQKRSGRNTLKMTGFRKNLKFRSGVYQDYFARLLWKSRRLESCAICYSNHHIPKKIDGGYLNGYCRCGSTLKIKFELKDCDSHVNLLCYFKKGLSTKKCGPLYLRGEARKQMVDALQSKNVYTYRAAQAADLMLPQDPACPIVRSSNVLHVAQSEKVSREYFDTNPIVALVKMKSAATYTNCIRNIGMDPFYVHYCSNLQTETYKKIFNKYKDELEICIDATGAHFKEIIKCDNRSTAYMLLYIIVINVEEGQFPIAQMITERHSVTSIQSWLVEWQALKVPSPKQICVDYSFALLHAAARSFGDSQNIYSYANKCKNNTPQCLIRIDRAHFIKKYTRFLSKSTEVLKIFYAASIGAICNCQCEKDARKIIKALLIMSEHETESSEVLENEDYLNQIITGSIKEAVKEMINTKEEDIYKFHDDETDMTEDSSDDWRQWLNQLEEEIKTNKTDDSNKPNAYRHKKFAKILKKDIILLPLWTKILPAKVGYGKAGGSTASCEGEINKIKNIIFKDIKNKTIRVDNFVQRHLEHLFGDMLLVNTNSASVVRKNETNDLEMSSLQEEENWRGKIIKKKRILEDQENIVSQNNEVKISPERLISEIPEDAVVILGDITNKNHSKKKTVPLYLGEQQNVIAKKLKYGTPLQIGIFRHCSHRSLTAPTIDGITYILQNSCPFDSVVQSSYVMGMDNDLIKQEIFNKTDSEFFHLVQHLCKSGINQEAYKMRATIMRTHGKIVNFNERLGHIVINCAGNAGELLSKLLGESHCSVKLTMECGNKCKIDSQFYSMIFAKGEKLIKKKELFINEIEEAFPKKNKCNICGAARDINFSLLSNLVIIDVANAGHYTIDELPKFLSGQHSERRELSSIVTYIGSQRTMGHYTAICKRTNGNWEEYDGLSKKNSPKLIQQQKIMPALLFYTKNVCG